MADIKNVVVNGALYSLMDEPAREAAEAAERSASAAQSAATSAESTASAASSAAVAAQEAAGNVALAIRTCYVNPGSSVDKPYYKVASITTPGRDRDCSLVLGVKIAFVGRAQYGILVINGRTNADAVLVYDNLRCTLYMGGWAIRPEQFFVAYDNATQKTLELWMKAGGTYQSLKFRVLSESWRPQDEYGLWTLYNRTNADGQASLPSGYTTKTGEAAEQPQLRIGGWPTEASNAFDTINPYLEFKNSNGSQVIRLVFTDYESVAVPASLTLAGNQGGEYLIVPKLWVTSTEDVAGTSSNWAPVMIGSKTGQHLELDGNEVMAKASASTVDKLYLNYNGGQVVIGSGGLEVNGTFKATGVMTVNSSADITNEVRITRSSSIANNYSAAVVFKNIQTDNNITTATSYIRVYDDHDAATNGQNMIIQSGGNVVIGGGESPAALYNAALKDSTAEYLHLTADSNIYLYSNCNTIANRKGIQMTSGGNFGPSANAGFTLGTSSLRWGQIYTNAAVNTSSDRNVKHDIKDIDEETAEALIMRLKPSTYKYNDGTSGRDHWGLIAQDVEEAIESIGVDSQNFAAIIRAEKTKIETQKLPDENGNLRDTDVEVPDLDADGNKQYEYSLRYEEFIAPVISMLQKQQRKIEELEARLSILEGKDG